MSNETTALAERDTHNFRLPETVFPERYEIKLTPDLSAFTFAGEETVEIVVAEPVSQIVLNAAELTIHKVTLTTDAGETVEGAATLDGENERATLTFKKPIAKGRHKLALAFTGILNDKLHGFYRSTYKTDKGVDKVLATTQFEATDARRAFPCWDEPEHKAVFKVTLVVDKDLTAISNAAVVSEKPLPESGKKEVVFADTVKMSTYLVAFIVGEFEATQPVMAGKTPIRIWAIPGKGHLAEFAKDIAVAATNFFSKYYGIAYPGDKMDLIAIPDFASGAMENLGAITFRETALLVDAKTASHAEKERIADVVAHEIAHMWFGDLVTMKWWNGLWLNEAFATFMEMLAVDNWQPQWKRWETFGVSRAAAFAVDGLKSTRPIEFPVRHPDEASAMFDVLTYEKGASVLRMLEQFLGEEPFRKGISVYLKKHEFGNAETTDLWDAIEESSREPVRGMMDSWIFQGGFPLLSAEVEPSRTAVKLSQQLFRYLSDEADDKTTFQVPVMLRAKTDKGVVRKKLLLKERSAVIDLGGKVEWLVVNDGGHGFYRVRYSADLAVKLTEKLFETLAPIERFNLLSDTWASTVAGLTPLKEYLRVATLFRDEKDKNVWAILSGSLQYLNRIIDSTSRPQFESFVRKLVGQAYERLGWQPAAGEDELTKQLRGLLIGLVGTLGNDPSVQAEAEKRYKAFKADRQSVDPNIVPALVSILAFTGGETRYDEFWQESKGAKTPQDEQRYLFALAGFRDEKLLARTLEKAVSGDVRTQNAPYLVQSLMGNVYGRELAWAFFKKNWDTLVRLFPENSIPRMCEGVTSLATPELEREVAAFFAEHKVKQGGKTIDQHLERLKVAVRAKEREAAHFDACFS